MHYSFNNVASGLNLLTLTDYGLDYVRFLLSNSNKLPSKELSRIFKDVMTLSLNKGGLIIENLPKEIEPSVALKAFGMLMAQPVQYRYQGPLVMNITPDKSKEGLGAASNTCHYFDPHTDLSYVKQPPDIVGLYVVRQDIDKQSRSLFCNISTVVSSLNTEILEELLKPKYTFNPPSHYKKRTRIIVPILTPTKTGFGFRFRKDILLANDEPSRFAVECLYNKMISNMIEFYAKEGSIIFLNNKISAHGRTAFRPSYDAKDRLLKRIFFVVKGKTVCV